MFFEVSRKVTSNGSVVPLRSLYIVYDPNISTLKVFRVVLIKPQKTIKTITTKNSTTKNRLNVVV